jgi:acetyltransferase
MKDAAFALPPINRDVARTMLQRTRISRVLAGYRGGHVYDVDAVTDALVALGAIALDLSEAIESIDINPFKVGRHGGLALDGLVILRRP